MDNSQVLVKKRLSAAARQRRKKRTLESKKQQDQNRTNDVEDSSHHVRSISEPRNAIAYNNTNLKTPMGTKHITNRGAVCPHKISQISTTVSDVLQRPSNHVAMTLTTPSKMSRTHQEHLDTPDDCSVDFIDTNHHTFDASLFSRSSVSDMTEEQLLLWCTSEERLDACSSPSFTYDAEIINAIPYYFTEPSPSSYYVLCHDHQRDIYHDGFLYEDQEQDDDVISSDWQSYEDNTAIDMHNNNIWAATNHEVSSIVDNYMFSGYYSTAGDDAAAIGSDVENGREAMQGLNLCQPWPDITICTLEHSSEDHTCGAYFQCLSCVKLEA